MGKDELRRRIDEIDDRIIQLLAERARIAAEIGRAKAASSEAALDTAREQAIFQRLASLQDHPLPPSALRAIFTEIISACRALQAPLKAAYLGPAFTFSHLAARSRFGQSAEYIDCSSVREVFEAVERGLANVGVVPIENSLSGTVPETLDCFVGSGLDIIGEHFQPIHHCLLGLSDISSIRRLHSHPQAVNQCRRFIRENLPTAEIVPQPSTAAAAQAAAEDEAAAAIAPAEAAEPYGLKVLARNIEDFANNRTRFFVIGRGRPKPTGRDKTTILFSTKHIAGALHQALTPLRVYGINMTMIQSRPVPGRLWEYVFFVDFEGHAEQPHVKQALSELSEHCSRLAILGSYPAAEA